MPVRTKSYTLEKSVHKAIYTYEADNEDAGGPAHPCFAGSHAR